jgi:hypothetical protein
MNGKGVEYTDQVVKRLGKDHGKSLCIWIGSGSSSKGSGKTKDRTALLAVRRVPLKIDRALRQRH